MLQPQGNILRPSTAHVRSPFFVIENFLSPKTSDQIVDALNIQEPDTDAQGNPIRSIRFSHHCESIVFNRLDDIREEVEQYFDFEWKGTQAMTFEFYPEDCRDGLQPMCSNSVYSNRKWIRNKNIDFTGVIFLSDYNAGTDAFDPNFEVFGGKLQFPQHKFSFNPTRGSLVIFPGGPHFIHSTSSIQAGDLFMVRFHITAKVPWNYDPKMFPGNFSSWF